MFPVQCQLLKASQFKYSQGLASNMTDTKAKDMTTARPAKRVKTDGNHYKDQAGKLVHHFMKWSHE
jgi:hypothetical protein